MAANLVICLMGPTASGKTDFAIEFAQQFPVDIISVDSAMTYREMNIGTAKPRDELLKKIPHHLINIRDPNESYSAGEFRTDVLSIIAATFKKKRIPLLVGGTMLYFHILQQGIAPLPKANQALRYELQERLQKEGQQKIHTLLQLIDPVAAKRIHPNDPQRLLRALEVAILTGKTLTEIHSTQSVLPLPYYFLNIALIPDNKTYHHQIIEKRFYKMLKEGFIEEVESLSKKYDLNDKLPSIRTVGYRQIWYYLQKKLSYSAMQEDALTATRRLSKRQMTWLRTWPNLNRFRYTEKKLNNKLIALIRSFLNKIN